MSVLIKGMVMPKHASVDGEKDTVYKCAVLAHPDNTVELVIDEIFTTPYYNGHDIQRYPLTEIPIPHGRLIDADKAAHSILMMSSHPCGCSIENVKDVVEWLKFINGDGNNFAFPTIIEAEVE